MPILWESEPSTVGWKFMFCLDCDWDNLPVIPNGDHDDLLVSLRHGDLHLPGGSPHKP